MKEKWKSVSAEGSLEEKGKGKGQLHRFSVQQDLEKELVGISQQVLNSAAPSTSGDADATVSDVYAAQISYACALA